MRESSEENARRLAAAVSGALEGFLEGLERHDLAYEAKESARQAGEVTRGVVQEGRAQAQSPEMRELGQDLQRAGHRTADATRRAMDATSAKANEWKDATTSKTTEWKDTATEKVSHVKDTATAKVNHATETVRENVENAKFAAQRMKEDAKVKAEAVGETGRRASKAPPRILRELKEGASAYASGLMKAAALFALLGLVALTAWVVLTVGLVAVLAPFIGVGLAALLVAVVYLLIAGGLFMWAKSAREDGRAAMREHVQNSKDEARHVVAPVRHAFGRGRAGI